MPRVVALPGDEDARPVSLRSSLACPQPGSRNERQNAFIGLVRRASESPAVAALGDGGVAVGRPTAVGCRAVAAKGTASARHQQQDTPRATDRMRSIGVRSLPEQSGARSCRWRERVRIEPTGATEGASVAVLKTGQTTRPDPLPPAQEGNTATASISTRAPRGSAATATVERAGRWSPKARGVDLVHGGEVGHVDQEHGRLDDAGRDPSRSASSMAAEVRQHPLGLLGDAAIHQLAGGRIEADLAGGEQEPVGPRGLAVGPDGARCVAVSTRTRSSSEQSLDRAVGVNPDRLGGRRLAEPGHRHDLAGERHDESGARRGVDVADGDAEALRPPELGGVVAEASTGSWPCRPACAPRPIASHWAMFLLRRRRCSPRRRRRRSPSRWSRSSP